MTLDWCDRIYIVYVPYVIITTGISYAINLSLIALLVFTLVALKQAYDSDIVQNMDADMDLQ